MTAEDVAKRADLLPHADTSDRINAPDPAGTPTGMFAGETDIDLRQEAATRRTLEEAVPDEPGRWKAGGAMPDPGLAGDRLESGDKPHGSG